MLGYYFGKEKIFIDNIEELKSIESPSSAINGNGEGLLCWRWLDSRLAGVKVLHDLDEIFTHLDNFHKN